VLGVPAATTSYEGMPKVRGVQRIRLLGDPDALVSGLPDEVDVMASHVDEVKDVPPGFRVLALGDPSRIQIMRADRRPMWGVQFHPERPLPNDHSQTDDAPIDWGRQLLQNFMAIAGATRHKTSGQSAIADEVRSPTDGEVAVTTVAERSARAPEEAAQEAEHDEQYQGSEEPDEDGRAEAGADVHAHLRKQPAAEQRADDADGDVAEQAEAAALEHEAGEPADERADQEDDE